MNQDFDHIASTYDNDFTNSLIGMAQREAVYRYLNRYVSSFNGLEVLEINCGTGVDAQWMSEKGANVTATDISPEMVTVTQKRSDTVRAKVVDIKNLEAEFNDEQFDLIFSNFGGLNCLDENELINALEIIQKKLKIGGKAMLVIMPSYCRWETLYFLAKGNFSQAFRRRKKTGIEANVDGVAVKTWYYSPRWISEHSLMKTIAIHPVGSFIPPSYLEAFIKKRPKFFEKLKRWERKQENSQKAASRSDHFFIYLQR